VSGAPGRAAAVASSAPILRAKLLDIISIMYQHHPRPKEFIMKYRIQVGAKTVPASVCPSVCLGACTPTCRAAWLAVLSL
jgi:hypothetical protein